MKLVWSVTATRGNYSDATKARFVSFDFLGNNARLMAEACQCLVVNSIMERKVATLPLALADRRWEIDDEEGNELFSIVLDGERVRDKDE